MPIYPFVGWIKLATGLVSTATAIMLFRLIPDLIRLPSPGAMESANRELQGEIIAHQATLASLDRQVRERNAELEVATTALAVQAREAVHRGSNLLTVVHTLAVQSAKGTENTAAFLTPFLGRLRALAYATQAIATGDQVAAPLEKLVEAGMAVLQATYEPRISASGPSLLVNPVAAQYISLALHELATNTLKYGLGASDEVRLSVRWTVSDETFTFVWHETHVPLGEGAAEAPEGFGTMLLTTTVPSTLKGTAERSLERGELLYRLTAPLAAITHHDLASGDPLLAARIIESNFSG